MQVIVCFDLMLIEVLSLNRVAANLCICSLKPFNLSPIQPSVVLAKDDVNHELFLNKLHNSHSYIYYQDIESVESQSQATVSVPNYHRPY